jgi:SWIM zinc finger
MPKIDFFMTEVQVAGSKGKTYVVEIVGGMPVSCSCPNYEHRAGPDGTMCKHMRIRSGIKAVGVTRCALCSAWLSPAEIESQPEPEAPDSLHDQEFARACDECRLVGS